MRKRKSLPPARCGSDWKEADLNMLNIRIVTTTPSKMLGCGKDDVPLAELTPRITSIIEECIIFDSPDGIRKTSYGLRTDANSTNDPRTRTGIGWVLLNYLSLCTGSRDIVLESVICDFLIQLLGALGYNDGDMVVLSVVSTSPQSQSWS